MNPKYSKAYYNRGNSYRDVNKLDYALNDYVFAYNLDPDFDINCLKKIESINSKDIFKITNKYLSKPFISVFGDEKICNKINELWTKNF